MEVTLPEGGESQDPLGLGVRRTRTRELCHGDGRDPGPEEAMTPAPQRQPQGRGGESSANPSLLLAVVVHRAL